MTGKAKNSTSYQLISQFAQWIFQQAIDNKSNIVIKGVCGAYVTQNRRNGGTRQVFKSFHDVEELENHLNKYSIESVVFKTPDPTVMWAVKLPTFFFDRL